MIPPAKVPPKVLCGKEKICQAFEIGETAFKKWVVRGMPVSLIDGRWTGHYDDIESFMRRYIGTGGQ